MARVPGCLPRVPRMRLFARLLRAGPWRMPPISRAKVNHKTAHYLNGIIYGRLPNTISHGKFAHFRFPAEYGRHASTQKAALWAASYVDRVVTWENSMKFRELLAASGRASGRRIDRAFGSALMMTNLLPRQDGPH